MIKPTTISRVSATNIKLYKSHGFDKIQINDLIEIPISLLKPKSNCIISCVCDNIDCALEYNIPYVQYARSFFKHGIYLCKKCSYKNTCLNKYGVCHSSQSVIIKNKVIDTMLDKYGVKSQFNILHVREKSKNYDKNHANEKKKITCIQKYGVDNVFKSESIKNKIKTTSIEKYGVYSTNQSKDIHEKQCKNRLKNLVRGEVNGVKYQGSYEKDFLEFCNSGNIIAERCEFTIKYICDSKTKTYFPDYYIPSKNLIIEIKSKYYYDINIETNLLKMEATMKNGHNFMFIIDKDYTKLIEYLANQ